MYSISIFYFTYWGGGFILHTHPMHPLPTGLQLLLVIVSGIVLYQQYSAVAGTMQRLKLHSMKQQNKMHDPSAVSMLFKGVDRILYVLARPIRRST